MSDGSAVRAWLDRGAERLSRAGIEGARDEMLRLAGSALRMSPGEVRLRDEALLAPDLAADLMARVERRAAGEPLAYVCGETGFRHLVLRCDRRALIPRPETEQLVELALGVQSIGRAADIGTGTGCIALSLAVEGQFDGVLAVDQSVGALALAQENHALVQPRVPVEFRAGDLTDGIEDASLALLASNPPYLTDDEWTTLDGSVRDWEPKLALPSGSDGLAATRRLLDDGRRVVVPGGWIALELDCRRAEASALLATGFGWTDVAVYHDLFERERFLLARRSNA